MLITLIKSFFLSIISRLKILLAMHPEVPSNKSRSKKVKQRLSASTGFVLSSHQVAKLV